MNQDDLNKLKEFEKKKVKNIAHENGGNIIYFEDGTQLPLLGGSNISNNEINLNTCSFCNSKQSKDNILLSPENSENPLICLSCILKGLKVFIKNGTEIDLSLNLSE
jgi:hypothetical protein